jgi:hypothetical protein
MSKAHSAQTVDAGITMPRALIKQAISILGALNGGADLEDGGDGEPSLASPAGGESQLCWSAGSDDDREQDKPAAA